MRTVKQIRVFEEHISRVTVARTLNNLTSLILETPEFHFFCVGLIEFTKVTKSS